MFIKIMRCTSLLLVLMGAMIIVSSQAFAGLDPEHGAGITAACQPLVYTCDSDADCDADDNECTDEVCLDPADWPAGVRDNLRCTFTVTNTDDFEDSIRIQADSTVELVINASGGPVTVAYPTARINGVAGNASCANGNTELPCTLGPAVGDDIGQVQFIVDTYFPTPDDPSPLTTQATVSYFDNCDTTTQTPDPGCDSVTENNLQASPQQLTQQGCGTEPTTCDDGSECTTDSCDPATGCVYTPITCDDGSECTTDSCDPETGCVYTPITCDDGSLCTTDSCDPETGCVYTPISCDDGDECTIDSCDPELGCVHVPDPSCEGVEICRTPGFWGARGGEEKGQNITLAVIGDGLEVCGQMITNTDLGDPESAIEAICINKGDPRAKLMRHLTSASLNCALGDCGIDTQALLGVCNDACADGTDVGLMNTCGGALDCFNNGGHILADGSCVPAGQGACSVSHDSCDIDTDCAGWESGETCQMWESCHDRMACPDLYDDGELNESDVCYEPLGPASSPKKCNEARKTTPYIFDLP